MCVLVVLVFALFFQFLLNCPTGSTHLLNEEMEISLLSVLAVQSAGVVEYTNCISAEE